MVRCNIYEEICFVYGDKAKKYLEMLDELKFDVAIEELEKLRIKGKKKFRKNNGADPYDEVLSIGDYRVLVNSKMGTVGLSKLVGEYNENSESLSNS